MEIRIRTDVSRNAYLYPQVADVRAITVDLDDETAKWAGPKRRAAILDAAWQAVAADGGATTFSVFGRCLWARTES